MVRATLSRAESLRLYFLTLPPSDRAEVLTVRDVRAADILRCMQDMQADGDASGTLLFSFAGAAQRRNLKSYGEWVLASRHLKPSTRDSPSQQALTRHPCPPELMISQRIMEASARTERELRLHFNSTLSVPVSPFLVFRVVSPPTGLRCGKRERSLLKTLSKTQLQHLCWYHVTPTESTTDCLRRGSVMWRLVC